MSDNPFKVHPVTNPDYKHEGDWYVDDGLQVLFFWDKDDAEQYADDVWKSDQRRDGVEATA